MRTTYVSHGNTLLAPLVGLILCVPHYIHGTMLLGDVTQAAAFVAVQGTFNWLIDNFPRLAECLSSANRVGNLLRAFDRLEATDIAERSHGRHSRSCRRSQGVSRHRESRTHRDRFA
jgi:ABC-type uncharacterized transport system fused permease/ATPase subunit